MIEQMRDWKQRGVKKGIEARMHGRRHMQGDSQCYLCNSVLEPLQNSSILEKTLLFG